MCNYYTNSTVNSVYISIYASLGPACCANRRWKKLFASSFELPLGRQGRGGRPQA